ncbi:hypothetical protein HPB50_007184 [Hyalomma asiaticum]|uniref:Uncharacterized protein n=1 Tax=Hyalomma asiaticum TaxID=266040 RepID=A0ACB7SWE5_HYAAI|nr:hypothetical protein HPB50_007184 [Hyalomma asiaticum]
MAKGVAAASSQIWLSTRRRPANRPRRNRRQRPPSTFHECLPAALHTRCTQLDDGTVCQLTLHLTECNRLLQSLRMELREVIIGSVAGRLHLAMVEENCPFFYSSNECSKQVKKSAAAFLLRLLRQHRCIVAADVNVEIARRPLLLNAIQESWNVRKISVIAAGMTSWLANCVRRLVVSRRHTLEELAVNCTDAENSARRVLANVVRGHGYILRVKTLDLSQADMNQLSAQELISGLGKNKAIKELTVDNSIFTCGLQNAGEDFTRYLRLRKPKLKKLNITQTRNCRSLALKSLTAAVTRLNYLEEVNVYAWTMASKLTEKFSLVAQKCALRTLRIERKTSNGEFMTDAEQPISRWLQALQTNTTLQELVIHLSCFAADDCVEFLRAVAGNKTLSKVTVGTILPRGRVTDMCELIRGKDMAGRLSIREWIISPEDVEALPSLPEVTSVRLCSDRFQNAVSFESAFHVISACNNVTTLYVDIQQLCSNGGHETAMPEYISAAVLLKDLTMVQSGHTHCEHEPQEDCPRSRLVMALCSNTTVERIHLVNLWLKNDEVETLASWVSCSIRLYEMSLDLHDSDYEHMARCLSLGLAGNYTVMNINLGLKSEYTTAINHVTTRNANLLSQAARFVAGQRETGLVPALDLMARHPLLVGRVQKLTAVGAAEATVMIRRSLNLRMHTELHAFMRIVGVVKNLVVCFKRADGRVQLDSLNDECWFRIRHYLKVTDVLS